MREVMVTREDVLKAMEASDRGESLSESCAMYQSLVYILTKSFSVASHTPLIDDELELYKFTPMLPNELYHGYFDVALAKIEENGPYKFQVEGI